MEKLQNDYDVVVVGGGTAGCAAAYIAGKKGLKTLLVEKNIHLGGLMTSGLVTPSMSSSKSQINTEFFEALMSELAALKGQITYQSNRGWFNPELCKVALDRLMKSASVDVVFDSCVKEVKKNKNTISHVVISSNILSVCIGAKYVVDATGNCDVGFLADCEFLEKKEEVQPVSLRFEMSGIDLKEFSEWLLEYDSDRNVTSVELIEGEIHLSTAYTWDKAKKWAMAPLFDDAVTKGVLKNEDRCYFQVFSIPGMPSSLAFNCPRVCNSPEIDPMDSVVVSNSLISARESIIRLAEFCKIYLPGFKKSYISNIADALGVRVSRRLKGKYVYTVEDLKSGKVFDNPVLISNYPIDVHSNNDGKSILEHTGQDYQLPLESLISADYENLFVVGRCLSADFYAQAALRIQPSCFSMGEGVAKHIAELVN